MNKKQVAVVMTTITSAIAMSLPAMANPVYRDAQNNVYVAKVDPGSINVVSLDGTAKTRSVQANRCGVIKVPPSLSYAAATKISNRGVVSDIASLPIETPGSCALVNGSYRSTDAPGHERFKDAVGAIYFQGLTPTSNQVVAYPELAVGRKITANACGYFKVSNSTTTPITNSSIIKINGYSGTTVSSLTTVIAPSCKKISETQSEMMVPLSQAYWWMGS